MRSCNKIIIFSVFLFSSVSLVAQKPGAKTTSIPPGLKLKSNQDSVQYALGVYLAQFVINGGFMVIDPPVFLTGMDDMFKNRKRLITDSNILPILTAFQKDNQKKVSKTLEEQLFGSLKDKPGIGKLPSGVQYAILKAGRGARPGEKDSVVIHFKGALVDKSIFEDTYATKTPTITTPGSLIPGLNEVLQLMPTGAVWEIYIPAALAYGEKGNLPSIPPNSALIIVIELLQIKGKG